MARSRLRRVSTAVALTVVVLSATPCAAQTRGLRFGHISVEAGLSNTWVRDVVKDSRGFLWIATVGGLNRYDGSDFVVYRHDPKNPNTLADSSTWSLFEDGRERLWAGAAALMLYDRALDRFERHVLQDDPGADGKLVIRAICEDRSGRLWVGTESGLYRYDPDKRVSERFVHDPRNARSLGSNAVMALLYDSQQRLWIATRQGLDRYDEPTGAFVHALAEAGAPASVARADVERFYSDENGVLWLGTIGAGLVRFDPATRRVRQYLPNANDPASIAGDRILGLTGDSRGALYVGVENEGLDVLDTRTDRFAHYQPDLEDSSSLASASIWALRFDDQGILWVGTYNAGVDFVSPLGQRFGLIKPRRGGLSDPHVSSVVEDRLGNLWIGTDGGGLNHLDRKTGRFTLYRHDPRWSGGLASNGVLAVVEDREQNIWIGMWAGGLQMLDPRSGRFTSYRHDPRNPSSLGDDNVRSIIEDREGNLLCGTERAGVQVLDRRTRKFHPLRDTYPRLTTTGAVHVVMQDSQGNLWLGALNGAEVVERRTGATTAFRNDPRDPKSAITGQVHAIREDSRGNVWIGSEAGGLACVAAGTRAVRRYTTADGLPSDFVTDILEDAGGSLWISTGRGLVKFEEALTLPEKPRLLRFDVHDGLQGVEFRAGAAFKSRRGEMFFGGQRGLNFFLPDDIRQNQRVPPVVLTDLKISNEKAKIGAPGSPLTKAITETTELTLGREHSVVTFQFAALNFILPQKNQYAYKLEGFDEEWIEAGTQRTATYTNLSQGRYTLRVRGSNNDGVRNDEGISLRIRVKPPFWRALWFETLVGLALVAGLVVGIRWRMRDLEVRRREAEALVKAKTAALEHEVVEHRETEAKLQAENEQRRHAEEEARQYVEKLAESNVELLAKQEALTRENSERQRAEQEAGWERDLLRSLMDNIPDLIYFKDAQSRFVRVNAAHAKAMGVLSPAAVVGRSDADFFPPEFARAALEDERELIRNGRPLLGKLEQDARSGRWYLATKVPLRGAAGTVTGLVGISKDITDRKRAEEKLEADLAAFRETIAAVARGDLTRRGQESDETVGQIARSVNEMLAGFSAILGEARGAALSVSSSSTQILSAATEIAKGAQYGNEQVQSTSSAVEEIAASMAQVSRDAEASADKARQVLDHLREGDRAVEDSYQGMTRIDSAATQTAEKMKILERRTGEVFEIIGLIEEIASRSTLLSLNAAIEAAHAGDAGRGFAVVAEEVRRLADRSGEATKNVATIVEAMVEEVKGVLDAMQTAMREVKQGRALSEQARGSLREVSTLVQDSVSLATQISSASREQVRATATVAEAMQTISNVSLESTAGANETTRAVGDLVRLSEQLNQAISRFKTTE